MTQLYLLLWVVVVLTLFSAFRYDNPDWSNYCEMYIESSRGFFFVSPDIGYNLLIYILTRISSSPLLLFATTAFLAVSININSFYKYTPYIFSCILLYFVHNYVLKDMIQIRAGLSSAICFYSLRFLQKEEKKKFFLTWFLAISVHLSAIIFGATYFLSRLNPKHKTLLWAVLACLLIGSVYPFGQIIKLVISAGPDSRIATYVAYGDHGFAANLGIWTNINALKCLAVFFFCWKYFHLIDARHPYFRLIFYAYVIGLCWMLLFNDFAIIGARVSNLLLSGEPILLSLVFGTFSRNSRIFYLGALIGVALLIFHMNIDPDKVSPYQYYFSYIH